MRLKGTTWLALIALLGLVAIPLTGAIVPAVSDREANMRLWLAARASGIAVYLLFTAQICFGIVLSHPTNKSTWKLSQRLFPWHENTWIFVLAFLAVHVVSLVLDPYAGVGITGAIIPGLSSYRSVPVALGNLGLWAMLATGLSARYVKLLPQGLWLKVHRLAIVVWGLAWIHGVLAGTDTRALTWMYIGTGLLVAGAAAYRYWASKAARSAKSVQAAGASNGAGASKPTRAPVPAASVPTSVAASDRIAASTTLRTVRTGSNSGPVSGFRSHPRGVR
jgi:methionine sulfoxide reductase heme-binding subunit